MSECFVPRIKAVSDIYCRLNDNLPITLRGQLAQEWEVLEERFDIELGRAREEGKKEAFEKNKSVMLSKVWFDNAREKARLEGRHEGFLQALKEIEIYFETHRAMDKYDFLCLRKKVD